MYCTCTCTCTTRISMNERSNEESIINLRTVVLVLVAGIEYRHQKLLWDLQ